MAALPLSPSSPSYSSASELSVSRAGGSPVAAGSRSPSPSSPNYAPSSPSPHRSEGEEADELLARHGLDGRCIGPGDHIEGHNDVDAEPGAEAEADEEGDQDATPRRPIDVANELNDRRRLAGLTKLLRGEHEGGGDGGENDALLLRAAILIRRLLSVGSKSAILSVAASTAGLLERLVELCSPAFDAELVYNAAWSITNIAAGTHADARAIVEAGAIPTLVELLLLELSEDVTKQALWALGNLAGDCAELRDAVLAAGALQPVLALTQPEDAPIARLRHATWLLSSCCRLKPHPPFEQVQDALPDLARLLADPRVRVDTEALAEVLNALAALSDDHTDDNRQIQAVLDQQPPIIPLCLNLIGAQGWSHPSELVRSPAMRTVNNIVASDDPLQCQVAIDAGLMLVLPELLRDHNSIPMRRQALLAASNVAAGSVEQVDLFVSSGMLVMCVDILEVAPLTLKKEAMFVLRNAATSGTEAHTRAVASAGGFVALACSLAVFEPRLQSVALEGLERMLRCFRIHVQHLARQAARIPAEGNELQKQYFLSAAVFRSKERAVRVRDVLRELARQPNNNPPRFAPFAKDTNDLLLDLLDLPPPVDEAAAPMVQAGERGGMQYQPAQQPQVPQQEPHAQPPPGEND